MPCKIRAAFTASLIAVLKFAASGRFCVFKIHVGGRLECFAFALISLRFPTSRQPAAGKMRLCPATMEIEPSTGPQCTCRAASSPARRLRSFAWRGMPQTLSAKQRKPPALPKKTGGFLRSCDSRFSTRLSAGPASFQPSSTSTLSTFARYPPRSTHCALLVWKKCEAPSSRGC